jgi:hypothetical protein
VDEDAEVPELLRYLVGGGRDPGAHSDGGGEDEAGPHSQPSDEVMEAVGDQDQGAHGLALALRPPMAVMPVEVLLQHVEGDEPRDEPEVDRQLTSERSGSGRQHVEEGTP